MRPLASTPSPPRGHLSARRVQFLPFPRFHSLTRRFQSPSSTPTSRAERILSRLPRPLQRYTARLRSAPISHVVSFLILHEITAVVPLLGLFGIFHYTDFVPVSYVVEHYGGYVSEGTRRFEKYFRRKGWFGFDAAENGETAAVGDKGTVAQNGDEDILKRWNGADVKYKVVIEVALAYAVTKALLPLRIITSVWATPWFANALSRMRSILKI